MTIKQFKTDYSGAFNDIDPRYPYYHLNEGLYHLPIGANDCNAFVYIPPKTSCSCWSVAILLDNDDYAESFIEKSGWKTIADEEKLVLFLLKPLSTWNECSDPVLCVEKLREQLDVRDHYVTQVFFAYLLGYSDGASVALRYTMIHPDAYAGLGLVGDFEFSAQEENLGANSALLPYISASDVPVPVYFQVKEKSESFMRAFDHFKKRNKCTNSVFEAENRLVSYPVQTQSQDTINGQFVADVIGDVGGFDISYEFSCKIWNQLHRTIRTTGVGPGGLHTFKTLESLGITTHEMMCGGYMRHWCEYIPQRNVSRKGQRPVVVFCHGGTQVAESGLYAAEWFNVAESRDFIVLFPSGGMAQTRMNANPMPTWNTNCLTEDYMDDELFIRKMIEDLSTREEIDCARIYITGHSMGSGMTQRCLLDMPDIFAAGASNSGVVLGDFELATTKKNYDVACLIEIGEHDVDNFDFQKSDRVRQNLEYWIERGDLQPLEEGGSYSCGRYQNTVWCNKKGVPMVRYVAAFDKTHSIMPQDAWTYYDDFLCKYSRDSEGNLCYLGKPVR